MIKNKKLIIIGDGEFAEIAYEYFTHDSQYEVVGFSVEKLFFKKKTLYELPIVPFEEIESYFSPIDHEIFTAITFPNLNRVRTRLYHASKEKGYICATYVSSKAFVWRNAIIGENCFIFENNIIQHHCNIGNNVVLWSGNSIAHRTSIGNNCFISCLVTVSGYCNIGENCFIGANSTFSDNVSIGKDCFIGAGCLIKSDIDNEKVVRMKNSIEISALDTLKYIEIS